MLKSKVGTTELSSAFVGVIIGFDLLMTTMWAGTYLNRLGNERELATTHSSLQRVTSERDELVQSRIPGLRPLAYDQVV